MMLVMLPVVKALEKDQASYKWLKEQVLTMCNMLEESEYPLSIKVNR
jgi:hypothetical protein